LVAVSLAVYSVISSIAPAMRGEREVDELLDQLRILAVP
jgi:hypothetical protein